MARLRMWTLLAGALLAPGTMSGCILDINPFSMGIYTPVPVPPWVTENFEEKYGGLNDFRTPMMPPIREGFPPPLCEDPPDEAAVLRAMPRVTRGIPYVFEEFRDNIQVVNERLVDKIDPPRFFPLVGPAQLHHCHWKCTVYYTETIQSDYPFPFHCKRPRAEVLYIDKDHLHLYVCQNPQAQQSMARDVSGP